MFRFQFEVVVKINVQRIKKIWVVAATLMKKCHDKDPYYQEVVNKTKKSLQVIKKRDKAEISYFLAVWRAKGEVKEVLQDML